MNLKSFVLNQTMRNFYVLSVMMLAMTVSCRQTKTAGPFTVHIRERAECTNHGTNEVTFTEVSFRKVNRTTIEIEGRVTSKGTLDDSVQLFITQAVWGNGGWKDNFLSYQIGAPCGIWKSSFRTLWDEIFAQIQSQVNVTDCPIPGPFSFYIKTSINPERFMGISTFMPELPYNRYLAEAQFIQNHQTRGCVAGIFDVVPRKVPGRSLT